MKEKRWLKITLIVSGSIVAFLLLILVAGLIFIHVQLNKIDRTEITGNAQLSDEDIYADEPTVDKEDSIDHIEEAHRQFEEIQKIEIAQSEDITNILLIGSDRRYLSDNGRSDSMIIVTLNQKTKKIHMTSLMRAMYVCIPRSDGNIWGMLNAAYSWGGPNLLVDTVELNFRVKIDHYVVVDIAVFQKAVDLVGGLELELTEKEAQHVMYDSGIKTPVGKSLLNGAQVRAYCQIRAIDNDFVRTNRQRTVLKKLIEKAAKSDIGTLLKLSDQIFPLVNTNLSNGEIISYVLTAFPLLSNPSKGRMLPVENESGTSYTGIIYVGGREMYKVDFEANIKALHEYIQS